MTLRAASVPSNVTVTLCGAGPGLNVDFAAFNFQVPFNGSELCEVADPAAKTITRPTTIVGVRYRASRIIVVLLLKARSIDRAVSLGFDRAAVKRWTAALESVSIARKS